jgi:hypothetical protein
LIGKSERDPSRRIFAGASAGILLVALIFLAAGEMIASLNAAENEGTFHQCGTKHWVSETFSSVGYLELSRQLNFLHFACATFALIIGN